MKEKIMIVDGNCIVHRAFYALVAVKNKNGIYTNAIYGFLNTFLKLYSDERPDYVVVAFDVKQPTFRHENYISYKATRKSMPSELVPQIPMLKDLLLKMNINICEKPGYEADDILGSLSRKCEERNMDVVLVSSDKDILQLATESVKVAMIKSKSGKAKVEDYYANDVLSEIGVTPKQYIDVKALMGDPSDNIPGVPSIGEKTAIKLIKEYGSLEEVIDNTHNIKAKKTSEALKNYKEDAILSKYLATIILDIDVQVPEKKVNLKDLFNKEAIKMLKELEFKSILSRYENVSEGISTSKPDTNNNYKFVSNKEHAEIVMDKLMKEEVVAVSIINFLGKSVGISFSTYEESFFIEFSDDFKEEMVLEICRIFLESKVKKILFNSKKDIVYLSKQSISLNNVVFDTLLAAYVLNSSKDTYEYNDIAEDYLNISYSSEVEISGKGKNKLKFDDLVEEKKLNYAASHTYISYKTYFIMKKQIEENNQNSLYFDIELPLANVLASMEMYGIKVDTEFLVSFGEKLSDDLNKLTEEIHILAGEKFNINSPSQVSITLFEKLGLKGGKKTATGYSTAVDILEKLKHTHEIIPKILDYRTLSKLKSTYSEGLLNVVDKNTGKIYSTFNQSVTTTGRISSTDPNLQNIPVRTELGRELRKAFIPSDDTFVFIDGDYSQIELRILAHISEDETMIEAYKNGEDIHKITASQVLKIPLDEVSSSQRDSAKAVNFGIVYGISSFSLSRDLKITKKEAEEYINSYFEKYPKIKKYLDISVQEAKTNGYATTMFSRRRAVPELESSNFMTRGFGERIAMNMPIQGSAADIIKISMIRVYNKLKEAKLQSRLILQVHDELLIEVKKDEVEIVSKILMEEMKSAANLSVPLDVDIHKGDTWFDAK